MSAVLPFVLLRWTIISPLLSGDAPFRQHIEVVDNMAEGSTDPVHPNSNPSDYRNSAPTAATAPGVPNVLIDAVLYDGYENNHLDEAIRILNIGSSDVNIGGWRLNDGESSSSLFPTNTMLSPAQAIWISKQGEGFWRHFGFLPDFELVDSPTFTIPNLAGGWPQLNDNGDQVILFDRNDSIMDCLVYEQAVADMCLLEWSGNSVWPYQVGSIFAQEGQILYRRRNAMTGLPVPDTNSASDWAQSMIDSIDGRRVRYPGWDLESYFFTTRMTETAVITVAIAPDNAFQTLINAIRSARTSIQIESLTFENLAIGEALVAAAQRSVSVTLLLEGAPVGGIDDAERYNCQRLESAGGRCWFMINDNSENIHDRYRYIHAKFMLIDGRRLIISTENLSPNSLPYDDKGDGTWGRRGVLLVVDTPAVANHVQTIFDHDLDVAQHRDILRWQMGHPNYGAPSPSFVPITVTGGTTYPVRFPSPSVFSGTFRFELVQSPENSLRRSDGLLGIVNRAGDGDTVLVQQLAERPYWGSANSNPVADPNPRVEAYLEAARRGAQVRLLLDAFYDDRNSPVGNGATCDYVRAVASSEKLPIDCALANPAGLGIHSKILLAQVGGHGIVHVGSINGTESSHKANRELAIQIHSDGVYDVLTEMFERDWPHPVYFPAVFQQYIGPAGHILISEVHYDPSGVDDAEFIELVNPTGSQIDLGGYGIGDAVNKSDFEDLRRFPSPTLIGPHQTLIAATSATAFHNAYGYNPDFELLNTDPAVPDLIDDLAWGDPAAFLQLGNGGDEVILRDPADKIIDVVVYGSGAYPGHGACELVTIANASLERFPYWRDTDVCAADFREWPFPNPGFLPPDR